MIWNRVERIWMFQIDMFIFIRFLDSRLKNVRLFVYRRLGYRIHRVVLRFNGRRGGTATGLFTETRYSRFFVRLKHGNIGIVPFGDGGNNNWTLGDLAIMRWSNNTSLSGSRLCITWGNRISGIRGIKTAH